MFVTLYAYRVKPGQREALHLLYQQWRTLLRNGSAVSTEWLANSQDSDEMIMLARFKDEDAAWAVVESPDYRAWYAQLVRLADTGPFVSYYK